MSISRFELVSCPSFCSITEFCPHSGHRLVGLAPLDVRSRSELCVVTWRCVLRVVRVDVGRHTLRFYHERDRWSMASRRGTQIEGAVRLPAEIATSPPLVVAQQEDGLDV